MKPSLGISLTESVREGLRMVMSGGIACPMCGRMPESRMTLREVGDQCETTASTVMRFLAGNTVHSDVLDRFYEFVEPRLGEKP